jgi:hypothetical protein
MLATQRDYKALVITHDGMVEEYSSFKLQSERLQKEQLVQIREQYLKEASTVTQQF